MQVAGRMAEVAMGTDYEQLFQTLIAQPLGMTDSHFVPINTDGGHAPMLGGGLRTTLRDYMHFLNMIYHKGKCKGKRILKAATVREMQADQVRTAQVLPGEFIERGWGLHHTGIYGLGEWRELIDAHTGEAYQISSPGWAGSYPWINKREGVCGFFITHVRGGAARRDGFSPFYDAPMLSKTVSEIIGKKTSTPR